MPATGLTIQRSFTWTDTNGDEHTQYFDIKEFDNDTEQDAEIASKQSELENSPRSTSE